MLQCRTLISRSFVLIVKNHVCYSNSKHKHNKCTENSSKMVILVWQYLYISLQFICDFLIVDDHIPRFSLVNHSRFDRIHIWFVTNIKQEQTICTTLDLIWRKQQVGQKLAFYFRPKLAVCSKPSQMCVILKRCSCLIKHAPMLHNN